MKKINSMDIYNMAMEHIDFANGYEKAHAGNMAVGHEAPNGSFFNYSDWAKIHLGEAEHLLNLLGMGLSCEVKADYTPIASPDYLEDMFAEWEGKAPREAELTKFEYQVWSAQEI